MNGDRQRRALNCARVLSAYLSQRHPDLLQNIEPILRRLTDTKHGIDFASVLWFGQRYHFSPTQAAVLKILWKAWEENVPDVRQESLLMESGSESKRLRDLFRGHPAWNRMIRSVVSGCYRLAEPDDPESIEPE